MPKVTLNIEDSLLHALRLKAVDTKQSIYDLVNDALEASLQDDLEDIKSWEDRKDEETYGYKESFFPASEYVTNPSLCFPISPFLFG